ncbi:MAG TPA: mycofactocin biosynthesis peptidyl-dipeptidase MftE, partial [Mycobacteriales bacterium]|nr:mycofactocin biosynthesis peptidyl-dipeptidase MftE [Mycobacteriales bacterium]
MTNLVDLAWTDLQDIRPMLVVPCGSTEQHGPHLPLSTDTDIAIALCEGLAASRPGVVVAPPLAYGSSGEHAGFPGTLSIGQQALELVVIELVRSAAEAFDAVVLVSGHGGNAATLTRVVRQLSDEGHQVHLHFPRWEGDAHAGRTETALMLALRPEAVRLDVAEVGDTRPLAELLPALRASGVHGVSANGVLGDPREATA